MFDDDNTPEEFEKFPVEIPTFINRFMLTNLDLAFEFEKVEEFNEFCVEWSQTLEFTNLYKYKILIESLDIVASKLDVKEVENIIVKYTDALQISYRKVKMLYDKYKTKNGKK